MSRQEIELSCCYAEEMLKNKIKQYLPQLNHANINPHLEYLKLKLVANEIFSDTNMY